jgi:hypothetical protein
MGNKGSSILKRQRELKKAEKAAEKRERRQLERGEQQKGGPQVASYDDLEGYGMVGDRDDDAPGRKQS